MKTKTLVLLGVLIIALAAMAMPVMAATANAATAVEGTLAKTVTLTATGSGTTAITLASTGTATATATTLHATENCIGSITAVDDMTTVESVAKPLSTAGYMANWTGTTWSQEPTTPTKLAALMTLEGATGHAPFTKATKISSLASAGDVYTFTTGGEDAALPLTFSQDTTLADMALPTGNSYRIPIAFVITCT